MKQFLLFVFALFSMQNIFGQGASTGLIPLCDLQTAYYKNYQGGLYTNGTNQRPGIHDSIGIALSKQILPLDYQGNFNEQTGKYVFLSIGMSNTTQEFSTFKPMADADISKNPKLVIVDGAQGGQTASTISNPNAAFWTTIGQRLQTAGVSSKQVQVCWVKEANANPTQAFPIHANTLTNELATIATILKQKYPNCKIAYLSSRTYGGYATTSLNPEPYAYESGFSVKWLIEKQINGDPNLSCTGENAKAPWLAWGPYLWADGLNPRSDGLIWTIDDFVESDRTHPSTSGRKKVADLLLNFVKTDLTARNWFLKSEMTNIDSEENLIPGNFKLYQNYPNPFNPETVISYQLPALSYVQLKIYDLLGREVATLVNEEQAAGTHNSTFYTLRSTLTSGVYIYSLKANGLIQSKKMVLIK
jgi:hypothetical protein